MLRGGYDLLLPRNGGGGIVSITWGYLLQINLQSTHSHYMHINAPISGSVCPIAAMDGNTVSHCRSLQRTFNATAFRCRCECLCGPEQWQPHVALICSLQLFALSNAAHAVQSFLFYVHAVFAVSNGMPMNSGVSRGRNYRQGCS